MSLASTRQPVIAIAPPGPAASPAEAGDIAMGMTRRWVWRSAPIPASAPGSSSSGGRPDLLSRILLSRGLADGPERERFLTPKLTDLHDPASIPDLDKAAGRLLLALRGGEPIAIYGDYDVDGITATAVLYHTFLAIAPNADIRTYVPHRLDEGYGLNSAAIEELADNGARVIVSVDCGVSAIEPARAARARNVDLIITDHHNPPATLADLPEAFAVVHPRRPDSAYPFADLCGAGVAFKLAWRIATLDAGSPRVAPALRALLVELLPLVALGTIADVAPLLGENRVLTRFGLERMKTSPLIGLRALVQAASLESEKVNAFDVGFKLAPRLNAVGRMSHARDAVELFTTASPERASEIARFLELQNRSRRETESKIVEQAVALAIESGMTTPDTPAIVLAHPDWHPGVVGIVCSRLVDRFHRPTILMQRKDGHCHGSARSIDGFNLHGAIATCADLLDRFGGHDMAAGLAMPEPALADFTRRFTEACRASITPRHLVRPAHVDADAGLDELTVALVQRLSSLDPTGRGNPPVTLLLRNLTLAQAPTPMGQTGQHLSFVFRSPAATTHLRCVAWASGGWGERRQLFAAGQRLDAIVRPQLNHYAGRTSVEAELLDLRLH
ncbi:MAG: single-stranded-DNA-specific exonuclease RecJ [Phycisphaerales bacterium]|jgi:single-stranded-DNA-specific exonuclease|nr:single-stranded-DNA-specific exonuclease RecJ [Phycisphaeraceae bacterium]